MTTGKELSRLAYELRSSDGSDATQFAELVQRTYAAIGAVDRAISERLGVSRTTVLRWRNGSAIPHPFMRTSVLEQLAKLIDKRIEDKQKLDSARDEMLSDPQNQRVLRELGKR